MIDKKAFQRENEMVQLEKVSFKTESHLKNIKLFHKGEKLYAQKGNNNPVKITMVSEKLKENANHEISKAKAGLSYLYVEDVNGQLKVESKQKLKGEGPIGAAIGTALGYGLVHGVTQAVSVTATTLTTGPASIVATPGASAVTFAYSQPLAVKGALYLGTLFAIIIPI